MNLINNARYYLAYTTLMVIGFNLSACKQNTNKEEPTALSTKDNLITIPNKSPLKAKLKESIAAVSPYSLQISTTGTIKAIPTEYAEIAPAFPGRVIKSYLKLGMKTNPETPLFEINAPDFISAKRYSFNRNFKCSKRCEH